MQTPTYVFSGDSVTDCARKRAQRFANTPQALGHGWVSHLVTTLSAANRQSVIYNRGFSGCRIADLRNQSDWWPESVQASLTTLMIGINDVWHPIWKQQPHRIAQALAAFNNLVLALKSCSEQVLVLEPVALPTGEVDGQWWSPLQQLTDGQQRICEALDVPWLALQDKLLRDAHGHCADYLHDGVHPTDLGHRWLAKQWLAFVVEQGFSPLRSVG